MVGKIVKIKNRGCIYSTYSSFFVINGIEEMARRYKGGHILSKEGNEKYKVLFQGIHHVDLSSKIFVLEELYTKDIYLCGDNEDNFIVVEDIHIGDKVSVIKGSLYLPSEFYLDIMEKNKQDFLYVVDIKSPEEAKKLSGKEEILYMLSLKMESSFPYYFIRESIAPYIETKKLSPEDFYKEIGFGE